MKAEFPIKVKFHDGGEWILETVEEVETNLEWFDTDDGDKSALVFDRLAGCGKRGVQRGFAPLPGAWGSPPDIFSSPFLARKGARGMVEGVFSSAC